MNVVVVPGNDNLLVRAVGMMGCAGINDALIVPGDYDTLVFAPPIHPAGTTATVMMVVVVVVVVRRADIMNMIIYTTDVYE